MDHLLGTYTYAKIISITCFTEYHTAKDPSGNDLHIITDTLDYTADPEVFFSPSCAAHYRGMLEDLRTYQERRGTLPVIPTGEDE